MSTTTVHIGGSEAQQNAVISFMQFRKIPFTKVEVGAPKQYQCHSPDEPNYIAPEDLPI